MQYMMITQEYGIFDLDEVWVRQEYLAEVIVKSMASRKSYVENSMIYVNTAPIKDNQLQSHVIYVRIQLLIIFDKILSHNTDKDFLLFIITLTYDGIIAIYPIIPTSANNCY